MDALAAGHSLVAHIAAARAALSDAGAPGVADALTQLSLAVAAAARGSLNTAARRLVTSMWHARRALGAEHCALKAIAAAHESVLDELDDRWVRRGRAVSA